MKIKVSDGYIKLDDMVCCHARRWWRTSFLCLWLALPLVAAGLLLRWDGERSRALSLAQADAISARVEAACWRRLVERNAPIPATYLQRAAFIKGCVES